MKKKSIKQQVVINRSESCLFIINAFSNPYLAYLFTFSSSFFDSLSLYTRVLCFSFNFMLNVLRYGSCCLVGLR